jgi:hypothetical protein
MTFRSRTRSMAQSYIRCSGKELKDSLLKTSEKSSAHSRTEVSARAEFQAKALARHWEMVLLAWISLARANMV